jgi:hypothetical protein
MTANVAETRALDLGLEADLAAATDPSRDRARSGRRPDDAAGARSDAAAMHTTTASVQPVAPPRSLAYGAFVAAAAFAVGAGIHVTHGTFDSELTTTVDYANDIAFTLGLAGCAAASVPLGRLVDAARWARVAAVVGPLLVAVGVAAGLALGHSPSWFAAVGIPGNLMWLAGLIGLGRATARSRALPRWVAYALPLGLIALLPFGEFGGSLLTAAVWGYVGVLLLDRT